MKKIASLFALFVIAALVVFYFAPAFRGGIEVFPDFFLGPVKIHWYGLLLAAGLLASYIVAVSLSARFSLKRKIVEDIFLWLVVSGIIGARIYYVVFSWPYFQNHIDEIFAFWRGGLSIYGAIAGGAAAAFIYARRKHIAAGNLLDILFLALPLGQAIGRFGNFFNREAFGGPTSLPWGMYIPPNLRPIQFLDEKFFHPAFLYESIWDLCVFGILLYFLSAQKNGKRSPGTIAAAYLALYGLGRFFIEGARVDSFFISSFRVDQAVAMISALAGLLFLTLKYRPIAKSKRFLD